MTRLIIMILLGVLTGIAHAQLRTNQIMLNGQITWVIGDDIAWDVTMSMEQLKSGFISIGGEPMKAREIDGKLVATKFFSVSNQYLMTARHSLDLAELDNDLDLINDDSAPSLRLLLSPGNSIAPVPDNVDNLVSAPGQSPLTSRSDILATADKTKIVVMFRDNGPIYSTTNSGMTWSVITAPGDYLFPLNFIPAKGGFLAKATIRPSPKSELPRNSAPLNWQIIGSGTDRNTLVLTSNPAQPTPALSIKRSNGGLLISWPADIKNFQLQASSNLNSTNWVTVTELVKVAGTENQVFIESPAGKEFFRLVPQ
jgi:hypothetical protein